MRSRLKSLYYNSTLATKIRFSYVIVLIPVLIVLAFCIYNFSSVNKVYGDMLNSVAVAGDFSLDFKKDFDYETYLLIVGNKSIDESELENMIDKAKTVVNELLLISNSDNNKKMLNSASKYLDNLSIYTQRIKNNILEGNKYEDNMEIWENDVQIVTGLIRETILQYIYYEIKDIQYARDMYQAFNISLIRYIFIAMLLLGVVIIFLSLFIPRSITKPIRELSKVTDQVAKGDLSVRNNTNVGAEVGALSESFNAMIDKINDLLSQVTKEQVRLRKAELELLQSQINPHFLYNTLDTIVWLAEANDQKKVVSMVGSLSKFFRTSLNQGKDIISMGEELQHVRSYLEIQQVRYQDILEYEIDVPDELYKYQIPKITIQPLVENALYHGIKNKRGLGKITISGNKYEDYFIISVKDNGIGMSKERLNQIEERINHISDNENEIFGLHNVNERIRLKFGDMYGISIESAYDEGTKVLIKLPLEVGE